MCGSAEIKNQGGQRPLMGAINQNPVMVNQKSQIVFASIDLHFID